MALVHALLSSVALFCDMLCVLPCAVLCCYVMSPYYWICCAVLPCCFMFHNIKNTSHYITLYNVKCFHAVLPCDVLCCYAMCCPVMLCAVLLCDVLRCVALYFSVKVGLMFI